MNPRNNEPTFDAEAPVRGELVELLHEYIEDLRQNRRSYVFQKMAHLEMSDTERREFLAMLRTARDFALLERPIEVPKSFEVAGIQTVFENRATRKTEDTKERKWSHIVLFFGAVSVTVAFFAIAVVKNIYHFGTTVNEIVRYIYIPDNASQFTESVPQIPEETEKVEDNTNQVVNQAPVETEQIREEKKQETSNKQIPENQTNTHTNTSEQKEGTSEDTNTFKIASVDENFLMLSTDLTKVAEQLQTAQQAWQTVEATAALDGHLQDLQLLTDGNN